MRWIAILLTLIFFLTSARVRSQVTDCEQVLTQAEDDFSAGRFVGIPSTLKSCLENGFTHEQRIRAYLILTQVYLILDDPIGAEDSYLKLLRTDPEYVANPARDPIDVYYLSKKFTTTPVFTPHFRLGLNTSRPRLIYEISTSGLPLDRKEIFKVGFQMGAGLDWNINNQWSLCGEINFATKSFKRETLRHHINDRQEWTEKQTGFDVPLYVKYSDDSGKIRPFAYIGVAANFLISASISRTFDDITPNSEVGVKPSTGPTEDIYNKRYFFNRSLLVGAGARYKIGRDFIYGDLRYMAGLSNLTKPEANYYTDARTFDPAIARYLYISDFFRLDNVSVSVGYIHPIYNPRKKVPVSLRKMKDRKSKKK
jgi:hypothetical protein